MRPGGRLRVRQGGQVRTGEGEAGGTAEGEAGGRVAFHFNLNIQHLLTPLSQGTSYLCIYRYRYRYGYLTFQEC